MKCFVEITETLQRVIEVEAKSEAAAERDVRERYRKGEIVLDGDDHVETEFNVA